MSDKTTPRLWRYAYEGSGTHSIYAESDTVVATFEEGEGCNRETAAENARLAVRAVNCHDELVAACENLLDQNSDPVSARERAWAILARAKGEA